MARQLKAAGRCVLFFFFSSRRRHTRCLSDWSSDVCSSDLGSNIVVDLGYNLNYSWNQHLTYNANYIPIGTGWPFNQANLNPTTAGNTAADVGSIFERTIYPGYGAITENAFWGHATYNALTFTAQKRYSHGLVLGM